MDQHLLHAIYYYLLTFCVHMSSLSARVQQVHASCVHLVLVYLFPGHVLLGLTPMTLRHLADIYIHDIVATAGSKVLGATDTSVCYDNGAEMFVYGCYHDVSLSVKYQFSLLDTEAAVRSSLY